MNNQNDTNSMLNTKLLELLSTIDKDKLNNISRMVQNMSKDDLNNLASMISKTTSGNNSNSGK